MPSAYRAFCPGRGGLGLDPKKTAVLFIEMQNEFTTEGGKLHASVRETMASTGMLAKSSSLAKEMRQSGVRIFHAPITFAKDASDNPNRYLGILNGCDNDELFTRGTWNAEICEDMKPQPEDVVVEGKRGLSAFPNTNLEDELKAKGIETIALGGFMANCCVESTMRDACEKGFNVITLTDCVATTSAAGWKAATEITYPFFSTPMNAASFRANIRDSVALDGSAPPPAKLRRASQPSGLPTPPFGFRAIAPDVYQVGPWFVDVRKAVLAEKLVTRSGEHELRRYLTFAQASGMMGRGICQHCDAIYAKKMPLPGEQTEPFGWLCNMSVVRLPGPEKGCLIYSPVLFPEDSVEKVEEALKEHDLLPVRLVIAPSPQHHLALADYQRAFPEAFYICGKASGQMPALTKRRRDLRFDGALFVPHDGGSVVLGPPVADREFQQAGSEDDRGQRAMELLSHSFELGVMDDNRTGEIVLLHKASAILLISDLLYKSNPKLVGPGGSDNHYTTPEWFAQGQEELFYNYPQDNSGGLLPAYRTHPRMRTINIPGMRASLDKVLAWPFEKVLACHTDPIDGEEAKQLLRRAWAFVWE